MVNQEVGGMNEQISTVTIKYVVEKHCICMAWNHQVTPRDVEAAFAKITDILEQSAEPLCVVVDLRDNPNFPLGATLHGALFGPYRNPKLKEWLIISSNSAAKMIERVLSSTTGRHNVRWFEQEEAVYAYLEEMTIT